MWYNEWQCWNRNLIWNGLLCVHIIGSGRSWYKAAMFCPAHLQFAVHKIKCNFLMLAIYIYYTWHAHTNIHFFMILLLLVVTPLSFLQMHSFYYYYLQTSNPSRLYPDTMQDCPCFKFNSFLKPCFRVPYHNPNPSLEGHSVWQVSVETPGQFLITSQLHALWAKWSHQRFPVTVVLAN